MLCGLSCSNQPITFQLSHNREPVGKKVQYRLEAQRVGTIYKNDELDHEIDLQIEADIIYSTKDILPNGNAIVLEENRWSYDVPADDSGKVKRKTKEYTYSLHVAPNGKVLEFEMVGDNSPTWERYSRSFYEQGVPVFPDEEITIGYTWTQKATVTLPNNETAQAGTTYRVKGTAKKMGYDCAIIEYKGNLVLPIFPNPKDSISIQGVDMIEMSGILYFGYDVGMSVGSEESRRVVSERQYDTPSESYLRRSEVDEMVSYSLATSGSI
jgi:hypothetical protein